MRFPSKMLALTAALLAGCDSKPEFKPDSGADEQGHTAPTAATAAANAAVADELPLDDPADHENATRGLVASDESLIVKRADGRVVWNQDGYSFMGDEAPASANPSLWRQAKLNNIHGLFKVTDRVYQLRGYDLANMTIIEGDSGRIIVDPLTIEQTAAAGMAFVEKHLGKKPIKAILFTHSHVDHFGGIAGVMSPDEIRAQNVRVIAPVGFMEEATSENVMAGVAMQRRASYMYGKRLAQSPRGHIGTGLGKEPPFGGQIGIAEPTELITQTPQKLTIDGIEFVFQNAPGSEAPAEFTFYLPQFKAFCGAEVVSRNLHNVYTLRGAKVRDALLWSKYIQQALDLFGEADVYFGSHHWPLWGNDNIVALMKKQRDAYKYIHDQTLRMANNGMTPNEIAEEIRFPESLRKEFPVRGYYGTIKHNAKAVYQYYFGWYDANPAHLDPHPPVAAGKRYVDAIGGADAVIDKAQAAFDDGDYRWVAELLNHLVFADPENDAARALLAKSYDQLGYQAESGPWRDVYLSAAFELRHGGPDEGVDLSDAVDLLREIPLEKFFDSMAARLNGPKAEDENLIVNFTFSDLGRTFVLDIENAVMHHREGVPHQDANASIEMTHELYLKLALNQAGIKDTLFSDDLNIDGSRLDLVRFFTLFDKPEGKFAIVTP